MINYQLAKELKDAGFPQTGGLTYPEYPGVLEKDSKSLTLLMEWREDKEGVYTPTLSELIEACDGLCKDFALFTNGSGWVCGDYMHYESDWIVRAEGDTPETAVAKLWLALHNK